MAGSKTKDNCGDCGGDGKRCAQVTAQDCKGKWLCTAGCQREWDEEVAKAGDTFDTLRVP